MELCTEHNSEILSIQNQGLGDRDSVAEEIIIAIERANRHISTVPDIAEDLQVSDQTIRNHMDDALEHPAIKTRKIRGAPVFWPDSRLETETASIPSKVIHKAEQREESVEEHLEYLVKVVSDLENAGFYKLEQ